MLSKFIYFRVIFLIYISKQWRIIQAKICTGVWTLLTSRNVSFTGNMHPDDIPSPDDAECPSRDLLLPSEAREIEKRYLVPFRAILKISCELLKFWATEGATKSLQPMYVFVPVSSNREKRLSLHSFVKQGSVQDIVERIYYYLFYGIFENTTLGGNPRIRCDDGHVLLDDLYLILAFLRLMKSLEYMDVVVLSF